MMSLNPYRAGSPVDNSDAFVGRTEILQAVQTIVSDLYRHAIVLYGQRRIGKTSVLKELEARLSNDYCVIFVDWLDKAQWPLKKVLEELAFIISISLEQEKPTLGHEPETTFKEWLSEQILLEQNKPLVFLFDEFDVIVTSEQANDIIEYLHKLLILPLNPQRLNWIFAIGCKIENLTAQAITRFRSVENRFISYLTQEETLELIHLSEKNQTLQWADSATRVWQLTAGHPYFTQLLCFKVWEHLYKEITSQIPTVTLPDIEAVIPRTLVASETILESLWRSLSIVERVVVAGLAQQQNWSKFIEPLEKITQPLEEARKSLIEWDLIDKDNYCFQVEIIRVWVEQKNLDYYEDLELIEPYAPKLYEMAERLNKEKHSKNAQVLLEQAIQFNPYHTKANQLLAKIWVDGKQWVQARQVLEDLYQYNPKAAQESLVKVLLVLAKSSDKNDEKVEGVGWPQNINIFYQWKLAASNKKREKQQLRLYEQVLAIEPDHLTAQQEIQKIKKHQDATRWKQRAKTFYGNHSKKIWQGTLLIFALGVSYVLSFQTFPSEIVLEVESIHENPLYILKGVPSAELYQLQSITISHDLSSLKGLPTFEYDDYQKIELLRGANAHRYSIDKESLRQELPKIQHFDYPYKEKPFDFTFSFEFNNEEKNSRVNFSCESVDKDKHVIPCAVKEKGYLSIFRGIPWYLIGTLLGIILIILIEVIYALKNREPNHVY